MVYGAPQAAADFPDATVGIALSCRAKAGSPRHCSAWRSTGAIPASPVTATLNQENDEVFAAPVFSAHWIIGTPVDA